MDEYTLVLAKDLKEGDIILNNSLRLYVVSVSVNPSSFKSNEFGYCATIAYRTLQKVYNIFTYENHPVIVYKQKEKL